MSAVAPDPIGATGAARHHGPASLPMGTVTFLFTDIEGSTRLLRQLGPEYAGVLERHRVLVRTAVAHAGGVEVRAEGDGIFVAFGGAAAAVQASVAAQLALADEPWSSGAQVLVRMGLHTGEAAPWDGDYVALSVHQAARVGAAANGSQILVSEATMAATAEALPADVSLRELGLYRLKDFDTPCHLYQLCHPRLRPEFPDVRADSAKGNPRPTPLLREREHDSGRDRAPLPARLSIAAGSSFIGRHAELEWLAAAWSRCRSGQRLLVTIDGAAGIGKSRLAAELAAAIYAEGATVLHGHSDEEPPWPYQPFAEALNEFVRARSPASLHTNLGGIAADLVRLIPTWADHVPGPTVALRVEPETERYRLFEAVASLVGTVMQTTPVLLVLDDLQWADEPSLLLLAHLVRHPDPGTLLVVATCREEAIQSRGEVVQLRSRLAREGLCESLSLRGLHDPEVSELVRLTTPDHVSGAIAPVSEWLCRTTEGNPFFVREMARHVVEAGSSWPRGGDAPVTVTIPNTIMQLIDHRLARLSPNALAIVTLGAVIGREFDTALLGLTGLPTDEQFDALDETVTSRILEEVPGRPDHFRFAHALLMQGVYNRLTATRRARMHLQVAEAMEAARPRPSLATLAHHFCAAAPLGGVAKALEYASRAGDEALRALAPEEAVVYYQRAVQVLQLEGDASERARYDLMLRLGRAQGESGDRPGAMASWAVAMDMADLLGEPILMAEAALAPDSHGLSMGLVDDEAVVGLERALAALPVGDGPERSRLMARLSRELFFSGDVARIRALTADAVSMAERLSDPQAMAAALDARHVSLLGPRDVEERIAVATRQIEFATDARDPHEELIGRGYRLVGLLEAGDMAAADKEIARHAELAAQVRRPRDLWLSVVLRSMRAQLNGNFDECEGLATEAVSLGSRLGMPDADAIFAVQVFVVRWQQGRLAELRPIVEDLVATSPAIPSWRCALALLHAELGSLDEARAQLDMVAAETFEALPRDWLWLPAITTAAQVCHDVLATEHASTLYALLLPHARRQVVVGPGFTCLGSASRMIGLLAATLGDWEQAERHLTEAIDVNDRIGALPWAALARCDLAVGLLRQGEHGRASDLAMEASDVGRRLGMQRLVTHAEQILHHAG